MRFRFLAIMLVVPSMAAAQSHSGGYLGGAFGSFSYEESGQISGSGYNFDESDTAFKAYGGYRFNEYFAVEASYADLGEPSGGINLAGTGERFQAEIDTNAFFGYAVGLIPVGSGDFFGKLGFASGETDTTITDTNTGSQSTTSSDDNELAIGLGGQYRFNQHAAVRAEIESIALEEEDNVSDITATTAMIGVHYRL